MIRAMCITLLFSFGPASLWAAGEQQLDSGMSNPGYHEKPGWFKNSFLDLNEDLAEASEKNKRLIIYLYQDGCPYCSKLLQDNWGQRRLAEKTRKHFDVIAINMWGDREVTSFSGKTLTEKEFSIERKVMFTPTILMLDEQGNNALRINGYYHPAKFEAALDYVAQKKEKQLSFSDYYSKQSPVKASGKLHDQPYFHKSPYALDQLTRNGKPLLVLFEQKQCSDCDELHRDILKRKETLEQIKKFNVVRLDRWSNEIIITPSGKESTAKKWGDELKVLHVPSMVFFDRSAKEAFRTEAYLKSFHTQSVMDFVSSGEYKTEPSLQRFIQRRAEALEAKGIHVDLMK